MRTRTLDAYVAEVLEKESKMKEQPYFTEELCKTAKALSEITAENVVIRTDYDADGICSAYILSETLERVLGKNVTVKVNDRRGAYGDVGNEALEDTQLIILDMGSNELEKIESLYKDAFVIDHHLTPNIEQIRSNIRYVNPKVYDNAGDYCTTGLCFRLYEILSEQYEPLREVQLNNTLTAMACIGTIADVVKLDDMNSNNRSIVKRGIKAINEATLENFSPYVGYFLQNACNDINGKFGKDILSSNIGMSIAPFINGAGRISELIGENGSQMVFDCLKNPTALSIARLNEFHTMRKNLASKIKTSEKVADFVDKEIKDFGIKVYIDKDGEVPHALCGILAGTLTESLDAPVIVLSHNKGSKTYSGSGRNSENTESLKEYLDKVVGDMDIKYGGHHEAIGISRISETDIDTFIERISAANKSNPIYRKENDSIIIDTTLAKLFADKNAVYDKLYQIEPIPDKLYVTVSTKGRSKGSKIANRDTWRRIKFKDEGEKQSYDITDWAYNDYKYEQAKILAELSPSTYHDEGISLTTKFSRAYKTQLTGEGLGDDDKSKGDSATPKKRRLNIWK